MVSYVQTNTIAGQAANGSLGFLFPTSQQPVYASRFSNALENIAESGTTAAPFLSVAPTPVDNTVSLGRSLTTPVAIQTPAAQSVDMTLMFVARLPNAPVSGNGNIGVMGSTMYLSTAMNAWAGMTFGIGAGLAYFYLCNEVNGAMSTQYGGAAISDAQAQAWGLYAVRVKSASGGGITATIQAITAGTSQVQNWSGTFFTKSGETPPVMLGADYIPLFGTSQSIRLARAYAWNYALTDAEINDMATLVRSDLTSSGVTV